jgi:hypothetical protein
MFGSLDQFGMHMIVMRSCYAKTFRLPVHVCWRSAWNYTFPLLRSSNLVIASMCQLGCALSVEHFFNLAPQTRSTFYPSGVTKKVSFTVQLPHMQHLFNSILSLWHLVDFFDRLASSRTSFGPSFLSALPSFCELGAESSLTLTFK